MKKKLLPPPDNATREEIAAWLIYTPYTIGCMQYMMRAPRERILRLVSGGYFEGGNMELASRRQKNEIRNFQNVLATIPWSLPSPR